MQMWLLSFALCITQLFVSPCTDPSTRPHIQVSDLLETCRPNVWYYYFPFWVFALWNVEPSTPFSPYSWFDPPNLSRCLRLFLGIYNCSLPVLMCSLTQISRHLLMQLRITRVHELKKMCLISKSLYRKVKTSLLNQIALSRQKMLDIQRTVYRDIFL